MKLGLGDKINIVAFCFNNFGCWKSWQQNRFHLNKENIELRCWPKKIVKEKEKNIKTEMNTVKVSDWLWRNKKS